MKKILAFLFLVAMTFSLWSCANKTCTNHTDTNGDQLCDTCGVAVPCTNHVDTKEDGTYKCDVCGTAMKCTDHKDTDKNLKCDKCGTDVECTEHVDEDKNNVCETCNKCYQHRDTDADYYCDICEEEIDCDEHVDEDDEDGDCDECGCILPCPTHKDADKNLVCDRCAQTVKCTHEDADKDLVCDICKVDVECTHADANNDGICDVEKCKWDYDHTHTYSAEWAKDAQSHWHPATCGHNAPKADNANHADNNNDGACDVCGWDNGHKHEYATEYSYDADYHWYAPSCNHSIEPKDKAAHVDNDKDGKCEVCMYQYCTHSFDQTVWTNNTDGHWRPATCGCNVIDQTTFASHEFGDDGRYCDICNYDNKHEHTYADIWSTTPEKHWKESTCHSTVKKDEGAHVDTLDNNGICDVCEYVLCDHNFVLKYNETHHYYAPSCTHNVQNYGEEAHVDENRDILCDVCGYNYGHEHTFDTTDWTTDETHHWHQATCGHEDVIKGDYAEHIDQNWDFKCDVCGVQYEGIPGNSENDVIIMPPHYIGGSKP